MWLSSNEARYYQRGPGYDARIRAQWRQVDTEHAEACAVRREWMALCGVSSVDIEQHIAGKFELNLDDELQQLLNVLDLKR